MKKRLFSFIIVFLVLVFAVPSAYASDADFYENTKKEIIYLADGSYIITTITEENARMSPYAAAQTKSGSKTSTVYSATAPLCIPSRCMETFHTTGAPRRQKVPLTHIRKSPPCGVFQAVPRLCPGQPQWHPEHLSQP